MADEQLPQQPVTEAPAENIVNVVSPDGDLQGLPQSQVESATQAGYRLAPPDMVQQAAQQAKYGTPGQQALAGLEGAGRGIGGSAFTALEEAAGAKSENIRKREETNPYTAGLSEAGAFVGGALTGVGEAGLLSDAGKAVEAASGLGKGGRLSQASAEALKGAFEGALYQGDKEAHKVFTQDPNQTMESAAADIGLSSVMSGIFGGLGGALLRKTAAPAMETAGEAVAPKVGQFVSEADKPKVDAGDFKATIEASDLHTPKEKQGILESLAEEKANAPEIRAAAKELDAPVLEGMIAKHPSIQKAEDTLLNEPPTVSALARQKLYNDAYATATKATTDALGEGSELTAAQLGAKAKGDLTATLRKEAAPISAVYDEIAQTHTLVPVESDVSAQLSKSLREIPEFRVAPSSPGGQLVKQVFNDIKNVKTLSDLKTVKDSLSLPATASSQERHMVGILRDKLSEVEDGAVERFAKGIPRNDEAKGYVESLLDQKRAITPQYKEFITKVSTLAEQLGKGRVHGLEDALHFINERLTPEEVAGKLFSKKDSEFNAFLNNKFPELADTMRQYQKSALREAASKTGEFQPKILFNKINALEPEIQGNIFTPQELKKLKASETYIRSFPKDFNPSGTSHASAFRAFFEHPVGAAYGTGRDAALVQFIKRAGPTGQQVSTLAKSAVKGEKTATNAIKAIFDKSKDLPLSLVPSIAARAKLERLVDIYTKDPSKMVAMNDNSPIPEHNAALAAVGSRAVQYLASQKPNTDPASPLDGKRLRTRQEQNQYERTLDLAQQPLLILKHLKDGRVTPQDLVTVKTIYPSLYNGLVTKMTQAIADQVHKGNVVPYKTRIGASLFTGQPLDSTMTPVGILSAQPVPAQNQPQAGQQGPKKTTRTLSEVPKAAMTSSQAREADRTKH